MLLPALEGSDGINAFNDQFNHPTKAAANTSTKEENLNVVTSLLQWPQTSRLSAVKCIAF